MPEYDFDEMARHFSAMRLAYLEYRRGGPQPSVEKKLQKYLTLSDLFFRKFPNPFADQDNEFIEPVKEYSSRSNFNSLDKKLTEYKNLRLEIEKKIAILDKKEGRGEIKERLKTYLEKCDEKIFSTEKQLDSIATSRLPV